MKNKVIALLMGTMVCIFTACGGETTPKASETQSSVERTESVEDSKVESVAVSESSKESLPSEDSSESELSPYLAGTYTTSTREITIDVPEYKYIEQGYAKVFLDDGVKVVIFTCLGRENSSTPEEAYELCWETTRAGVDYYGHINEEGHNLTVTEKTVGDIETLYYEGTMRLDRYEPYRTAQTYGYAFTYLGRPCMIWGYVLDKEQPQDQIDEIKNVVDAMMESVRKGPKAQ